MRNTFKRILHPFLNAWYQRSQKKTRYYTYNGLRLKILPGVFHPHYFLSTQILLDFMLGQGVQGKHILELGAGSGLISFVMAQNGAKVTASDINPNSIQGLKDNKEALKIDLSIVESDLFSNLKEPRFDCIVVNPPYYPKNPKETWEKAWYCGEDFAYFRRFFEQLKERRGEEEIYMILSQDCEIKSIQSIGKNLGFVFHQEKMVKKMAEENYIFSIRRGELTKVDA